MHKKTTRIINPVFDGLAGDTGQHLLLTFVPRHIDPDDSQLVKYWPVLRTKPSYKMYTSLFTLINMNATIEVDCPLVMVMKCCDSLRFIAIVSMVTHAVREMTARCC